MSSINCVRGAAAGAIEAVLFNRPEHFAVFQPAVVSLLNDPHTAVRAAALGLALPLLNINRTVAVDAFRRGCSHEDDEVLLAYDLNHFLRYTILDYADRLMPLIERMVASQIGEVAKSGARWAVVAWVHRGLMEDVAIGCAEGSRWQRMGVAEALSAAVAKGYDHAMVLDRLRSLFDDPDKGVRDMASRVFRNEGFFDQTSALSLAEAFLRSRALDDNVDDLLYGLEGLTKPLRPYAVVICSLADRFAGPLAAEARDFRTRRPLDVGLLAKVMLRLYEQSDDNRALRCRCLDAWDDLLREGIGTDVLSNIDA
jgi:hypothetical protein